jgi:hypothetical protein
VILAIAAPEIELRIRLAVSPTFGFMLFWTAVMSLMAAKGDIRFLRSARMAQTSMLRRAPVSNVLRGIPCDGLLLRGRWFVYDREQRAED